MVQASKTASRGFSIAIGIAGIVALVGIGLWLYQLTTGLAVTDMRNMDSWGLYITCFMFFVGLSAGGLIVSSIPNAFGMEGFGGISKIAIWTSICCTIAAVALVVIDLGQPLRLWELIAYSNFSSPLMWDIMVIMLYLAISIVYLAVYVRFEAGAISHSVIRVVSVCALVIAVLVHSVTAWIFSLSSAHEFWHTALLGPWFVSSALVCGTALVMVVCVALRRAGYLELDQRYLVKMAKMLGAFVCVDLYFFGCDLLTSAYPGGDGAQVVSMLTTGQLAPFFWVEVVGCAVCAVVCFVPALRTTPLLMTGSVLAIVGIFCKRVQLLVGGFQQPNLDFSVAVTPWQLGSSAGPTMASGFSDLVYWPQPIEFAIVLGVFGLALFTLLLGLKLLPLKPCS